jgi:CRP-like cAMP-binding protein
MNQSDYLVLKKSGLFRNLTEDEMNEALRSLSIIKRGYKKGSFILNAGDTTGTVGMVLFGSVTIENNDIWGNRTVLSRAGAGEVFAEAYALLENEPLVVDVSANDPATVAFIDLSELWRGTNGSSGWRSKLLYNLLIIAMQKNRLLSERSFHTSPKSARGRIMAFLSSVSLRKGSSEFTIPFDRQEMADYLNLDRTALSKELGRMRNEGLIEFHKNRFKLLETDF